MSTIPEKPENTRICEECGKNPTIQPNSPLCASCIGKRPKKNRGRSKAEKKEGNKVKVAKPEKIQQGGNAALTIDFGKHVDILRQVEKFAEEELRPVPLQVIYMLKRYISDKGVIKSV